MPLIPADQMPDSTPGDFDPDTVRTGHIKDPVKIAAKIEAARVKHDQATLPNPIEEESPAPPVQVIERRVETVTVGIPLGEPPHEIPNLHINVGLTRPHAHTFARLRQALADKHAKTADGRDVTYAADALRWLLERIESC
jgi:hypothetical protein